MCYIIRLWLIIAVNKFAIRSTIRLAFKKFSICTLHCRPLYVSTRPIFIRIHIANTLLRVNFDPHRYLLYCIFIHDAYLQYHLLRANCFWELVNCDNVLFWIPIELYSHWIIEVPRIRHCQILYKFRFTDDYRGVHKVHVELNVATAMHQG